MGNSTSSFKEIFKTNEDPSLKHGSPICVSVQSLTDPRSPTTQFSRTPIEVDGLPIRTRTCRRTPSPMLNSLGPTARGSYLDDDSYVESSRVEEEEVAIKMRKLQLSPTDPRSPTVGIVRTPIQLGTLSYDPVEKTSGEEPSPSDSFVTTISREDDLVFQPDESPRTPSSKQEVCLPDPRSPSEGVDRTPIQVECASDPTKHLSANKCMTDNCTTPKMIIEKLRSKSDGTSKMSALNESVTGKQAQDYASSAKCNKENVESLAKKLFGTPDSKQVAAQIAKVRTPLGTVSANNSPHQILRAKQSRGINQELERMLGIENALSETQNKKHVASEWDKDPTVI